MQGWLLDGYEIVQVFHPFLSSDSLHEMDEFLANIGVHDWFYEDMYSKDKEYFFQWEESEHERDSSGSTLTVWKKKLES